MTAFVGVVLHTYMRLVLYSGDFWPSLNPASSLESYIPLVYVSLSTGCGLDPVLSALWCRTMSMDYDFHLDYFPVRGRIEPILLRLADSGVPFHLEEIRAATWMQWKKLHQITPDNFPFSGVPVLRTKDRSTRDGGKELVLGEVSAILTFLDEVLAGSVRRQFLGSRDVY